ncbi:MAG: poly(hydroxyalkanoate) granule-associated protein, partial [Variovorax sp.]
MTKRQTEDDPNAGNADRVKDSAQQIWLAGLGAFAKMQQEGSKAF